MLRLFAHFKNQQAFEDPVHVLSAKVRSLFHNLNICIDTKICSKVSPSAYAFFPKIADFRVKFGAVFEKMPLSATFKPRFLTSRWRQDRFSAKRIFLLSCLKLDSLQDSMEYLNRQMVARHLCLMAIESVVLIVLTVTCFGARQYR